MPTHPALRALAATAVTLSTLALVVACGGGGGASTPSPAAEGALRAARPGELVEHFKSRMSQWSTRMSGGVLVGGGLPGSPPPVPAPADMAGTTSSFSGTNLQEAGVDEDDLIKTDGSFIYALHPGYGWGEDQVTARLESSRIQPDGSLAAPRGVAMDAQSAPSGMYLLDDAQRIAVLGSKATQVSLDIYAVADDAAPAHAHQVLIDGYAISSRRIGNVLYLASTWSPDLSRYWLPYGTPAAQVQSTLATMTASELLPTIRVDGGPAQPLVAERDCRLQPGDASLSLQLTTITAIDLSTPALERRSVCLLGAGQTLYMSTEAVYVATSRNYWIASDFAASTFPSQATTDIHKFSLEGLQVGYRGAGEVTGHLGWDNEKAPYRMSEHEGHLRVLTFTGETGWGGGVWLGVADVIAMPAPADVMPGVTQVPTVPAKPASPATLTVLREDPDRGRLVQVAVLPNAQRPAPLGREGEQVYAVQFAGPLAYVVTFRQVDPLYVLDLSDPADPKTVGELTVPGYSDYLFPLADGKLLGVGKDATDAGLMQGLKIALFDVGDPSHPSMLSSISLGSRGSVSALDYSRHGINIRQQGTRARIALPVRLVGQNLQASQQGLARFVVDTSAETLQERPIVAAPQFDGTRYTDFYGRLNLANERSIQGPHATYYLSGGQVSFTAEL